MKKAGNIMLPAVFVLWLLVLNVQVKLLVEFKYFFKFEQLV